MSKLMIVMVVLLSLAVAGLFLVKHENASLRALRITGLFYTSDAADALCRVVFGGARTI